MSGEAKCEATLGFTSGARARCGLAAGHLGAHVGNIPGAAGGGVSWGLPNAARLPDYPPSTDPPRRRIRSKAPSITKR